MVKKSEDVRDQISRSLDELGYDTINQLIREAIFSTRDIRQAATCPKCGKLFTIDVKQPAPDKRAKALAELANQAKGAPGKAAEKEKPPSMADKFEDMSTEQLEKLAAE